MLVMALVDIAGAAGRGRPRGRDVGGGAAGHRPGVRRRPAGTAPADRAGHQRRPDRRRAGRVRRSWPRTPATRTPGCRTPTRCAARPPCTAPRGTPSATRPRSPSANWPVSIDNPVVLPDGRVESNGNFHGAPVAAVLDFLAISVADVAGDLRAPDRPDARRVPLAGPAAVPGARGRRRLRAHDRAVHPGRDRLRAQAAGRAGVGGFHPVLGDAGGPRVDGLARRSANSAAPSTGCAA